MGVKDLVRCRSILVGDLERMVRVGRLITDRSTSNVMNGHAGSVSFEVRGVASKGELDEEERRLLSDFSEDGRVDVGF